MAGSFNKVLLMGNLTRDPELKYTPNNTPVAQIGLAVNRRYKTRDGESREETCFVECEAWSSTAEVMSNYLSKGRPVFIEGRLKLDQWQDQEGNNRSRLKVVIENFQFIDSRGDGDAGGGGGGGGGRSGHSSAPSGSDTNIDRAPVDEDDIPF